MLYIYQINCRDCPASYIDKTKRSLNQQSKEHQRAVKNCDTEENEMDKHCRGKDHIMDWENKSDRSRTKYSCSQNKRNNPFNSFFFDLGHI